MKSVKPVSEAQSRAISNLAKRRGITFQELEEMTRDICGVTLEELSSQHASIFIRHLQTAA